MAGTKRTWKRDRRRENHTIEEETNSKWQTASRLPSARCARTNSEGRKKRMHHHRKTKKAIPMKMGETENYLTVKEEMRKGEPLLSKSTNPTRSSQLESPASAS